jgi:hypothetical protein
MAWAGRRTPPSKMRVMPLADVLGDLVREKQGGRRQSV